jgi:hypothetical protein
MNILSKTILASALFTSSAFSAEYFIGGSLGLNFTTPDIKREYTGDDLPSRNFKIDKSKASFLASVDGGAVFSINQRLGFSLGLFADLNSYSQSFTENKIDYDVKQTFAFGANSNLIANVGNDFKVYGGFGLGVLSLKVKTPNEVEPNKVDGNPAIQSLNDIQNNNYIDKSKMMFFGRLILGTEYKINQVSLFAEAYSDIVFSNSSDFITSIINGAKYSRDTSYEVRNSGLKVGVRYFF